MTDCTARCATVIPPAPDTIPAPRFQTYGPRVDEVIDRCADLFLGWSRADWIELAIAAADQAGVDLEVQDRVRDALSEDGGR